MGPSIAAAGLVWGLSRTAVAASLAYASLAIAFAMSAPLVRVAAWVNALPVGAQWYVRPAGDLTNFTLFPWAGFVFAGGAAGVLIAAARDQRTESARPAVAGSCRCSADRFGVLWRVASDHLSAVVVLDQLAHLFRDPHGGDDARADRHLHAGASGGPTWQHLAMAGTPRSPLVVRLLDPRGARIWVCYVANPTQVGDLGDRHRVAGILPDDLRVCRPAGPPGRKVASPRGRRPPLCSNS